MTHLSDHFGWEVEVASHSQPQEKLMECGLTGSVHDKIADCLAKNQNNQALATKPFICGKNGTAYPCLHDSDINWWLVTKTHDKELWYDSINGLVWSDVVGEARGDRASDLCDRISGDLNFRVPSLYEFQIAEQMGARSALKQMASKWFWLSYRDKFAMASGHTGQTRLIQSPASKQSVRCVANAPHNSMR